MLTSVVNCQTLNKFNDDLFEMKSKFAGTHREAHNIIFS